MTKKVFPIYSRQQLIDDFKNWSNLQLTEGSARSYSSYLKRYFNFVDTYYTYKGQSIVDLLPSIAKYDDIHGTQYANTILILLWSLPYDPANGSQFTLKAYNDGRSALRKLMFFFITSPIFQNNVVNVKPAAKNVILSVIKYLNSIATAKTYNYNLLFDVFKARLITQDRYPAGCGIYLPMRILNKIFNGDKNLKPLWQSLLKTIIDNIKVYYYTGKPYIDGNIRCTLLKNIKNLTINSTGEVWLSIKRIDGTKLMATEKANYLKYNQPPRFKPLLAKTLASINLQHDRPISTILKNATPGTYKTLADLRGCIDKTCQQNGIVIKQSNAPKIAKVFDLDQIMTTWNTNTASNAKFKSDLFNEVSKLFSDCPLSLMEEKENKSINDYDPGQCENSDCSSGHTQGRGTLTNGIIKVIWTSPWHSFGRIMIIEIENDYDYASKELTVVKKIYDPNSSKTKTLGGVVLSASREKEIKRFLEDRSNIEQFFEAESWPDGDESTSTLTIQDVDGKTHTIRQLGDRSFKHPFGFETEGIIKATWTSAWSSFLNTPITVMEYDYYYELSLLTCRKTIYEPNNGVHTEKSSGKIKLSCSKEKEIKQFFEDRDNIKRFFEAESWQGSHESTTTLRIRDVDGREYAIQQIGDYNFKHPFGK